MTPFHKDCENIRPVRKVVYLADGSKISCNKVGDIVIPMLDNRENRHTLRLKNVLIIPKLDRRLFSVNSFLTQGNCSVNFKADFIELITKSGPKIKIPMSSLLSTVMNFRESSTQETTEISNNNKTQLKTKKIPSDIIHSRFHKSEGVIATINSETLWEDVRVIPSIDKFCTSCKITSIPHRARVKTRNSTPKTFLEEIQVDTVPNPEPLGVSSETRAKFFLIFCDRYSRIF